MGYQNLLVDETGAVRVVTVNRPAVRNAINADVLRELAHALAAIEASADARCVILTGAGDKAFAAGADIAAMQSMGAREAHELADLGHTLGEAFARSRLPVLAAVNGFALGGGLELALLADVVLAADTAKLGFPEVTLAVIPGFGGTQRLPARVGPGRARQLIFSGAIIAADEAARIGLVDEVAPAADLMTRVRALAALIASRGPLAIAAAKRAMRVGSDLPLERGLAIEADTFASLFATADQKEGMRAFLEKRPARFEGK